MLIVFIPVMVYLGVPLQAVIHNLPSKPHLFPNLLLHVYFYLAAEFSFMLAALTKDSFTVKPAVQEQPDLATNGKA